MNGQGIITTLIPASLAVIMFGMGLRLTVADFTRVARYPRAAGLGLVCQMLALPLVAFALVSVVPMRPEFAIGVMVIALAPGGAVSNLFSLLARGDIALSVSMTAVSSALSVLTVPLLLNLALLAIAGEGREIHLPVGQTMAHIAWITVIPVSLGMLVHHFVPRAARAADRPVRVLSVAFLAVAIGLIVLRERGHLGEYLMTAGPATIALNVVAMALGYWLATRAGLTVQQRHTITIEVGIQNAILATAVAVSPAMLGSTTIAIVPTVYGFTMALIASAYVVWALRDRTRRPVAVPRSRHG